MLLATFLRASRGIAAALLALLIVSPTLAQSHAGHADAERVARFIEKARADPGSIHIVAALDPAEMGVLCRLKVAEHASGHHVPRIASHPTRTRAKSQRSANFDVEYVGFTSDFQASFQRAVDTWAALLNSTTVFQVEAQFGDLGDGVLGSAGPGRFLGLRDPDTDEVLFFAQPLAEAILGQELNTALLDPGEEPVPDIEASFNSAFTNWYTGEGDAPRNLFDFETVVLHELGHGLHFLSFSDFDDGIVDSDGNRQECAGVANTGCIKGGTSITDVFTTFIEDGSNRDYTTFAENSVDLGSVMRNNASLFDGPGIEARLYSPSDWDRGSSISHLDESFNGTDDALMTFSVAPGDMERAPGATTCQILGALGWSLDQAACAALGTPVEDVAFLADGLHLEAYPAPLKASGTARLTLPAAATVRLALYDVLGREVATLHDGVLSPGIHPFPIDAADLPAGMYLLRASGDLGAATRSIVHVR